MFSSSSSSSSSKIVSANQYNKHSPNPASITGNLTSDELCKIAITDAWHDHHTIKGLDSVLFARKHLTTNGCTAPSPLNEDTFMFERILQLGIDRKYARPVDCASDTNKQNWVSCDDTYKIGEINPDKNIYTSIVTNRYRVFHIFSKDTDDIAGEPAPGDSVPETSSTEKVSLIQTVFKLLNITDDIHFIRDVGYGNLADDINKWSEQDSQTATFLITSQGQYDPGPTTTCITDAGERLGMGAKSLKYSSNKPNKNVRFGIYNTKYDNERITFYPKFEEIEIDKTKHAPQTMISSKFDAYMVSEINWGGTSETYSNSNLKDIFANSNTTLYILDPTDEMGTTSTIKTFVGFGNNRNIFKIDKHTSNKADSLKDITEIISYSISASGLTNSLLPFNIDEYDYIYTSEGMMKILSKKFGDHSQAIKTIDPIIHYDEVKYEQDKTLFKKNPDLFTKGIHVFVSYDRVAAVSAIEYGAPVILFNTQDGFILYISKNLINDYDKAEGIINGAFGDKSAYVSVPNKLKTINIDEYLNVENYGQGGILGKLYSETKNKLDAIETVLKGIIRKTISEGFMDDATYIRFLKLMYVFSEPLKMIKSGFLNIEKYYEQINYVSQKLQPFDFTYMQSLKIGLQENNTTYDPNTIKGIIDTFLSKLSDEETKKQIANNLKNKQFTEARTAILSLGASSNDLHELDNIIGGIKAQNNYFEVYSDIFNLEGARKAMEQSYGLCFDLFGSILTKLDIAYVVNGKKRNVSKTEKGPILLPEFDDKLLKGKITVNEFIDKLWEVSLKYIHELISKNIHAELVKSNAFATFTSEKRRFISCSTNAFGVIPSLGIPIIKEILFRIPDADIIKEFKAKYKTFRTIIPTTISPDSSLKYKEKLNVMLDELRINAEIDVEKLSIGGTKGIQASMPIRNRPLEPKKSQIIRNATTRKKQKNKDRPITYKAFRDLHENILLFVFYFNALIHYEITANHLGDLFVSIVEVFNKFKTYDNTVEYISFNSTKLTEMFSSGYNEDYFYQNLSDGNKFKYLLMQVLLLCQAYHSKLIDTSVKAEEKYSLFESFKNDIMTICYNIKNAPNDNNDVKKRKINILANILKAYDENTNTFISSIDLYIKRIMERLMAYFEQWITNTIVAGVKKWENYIINDIKIELSNPTSFENTIYLLNTANKMINQWIISSTSADQKTIITYGEYYKILSIPMSLNSQKIMLKEKEIDEQIKEKIPDISIDNIIELLKSNMRTPELEKYMYFVKAQMDDNTFMVELDNFLIMAEETLVNPREIFKHLIVLHDLSIPQYVATNIQTPIAQNPPAYFKRKMSNTELEDEETPMYSSSQEEQTIFSQSSASSTPLKSDVESPYSQYISDNESVYVSPYPVLFKQSLNRPLIYDGLNRPLIYNGDDSDDTGQQFAKRSRKSAFTRRPSKIQNPINQTILIPSSVKVRTRNEKVRSSSFGGKGKYNKTRKIHKNKQFQKKSITKNTIKNNKANLRKTRKIRKRAKYIKKCHTRP